MLIGSDLWCCRCALAFASDFFFGSISLKPHLRKEMKILALSLDHSYVSLTRLLYFNSCFHSTKIFRDELNTLSVFNSTEKLKPMRYLYIRIYINYFNRHWSITYSNRCWILSIRIIILMQYFLRFICFYFFCFQYLVPQACESRWLASVCGNYWLRSLVY